MIKIYYNFENMKYVSKNGKNYFSVASKCIRRIFQNNIYTKLFTFK